MKTIFKFCIIVLLSSCILAQNPNYYSPVSIFEIAKNEHNNGWVEFKETLKLNHQTLFLDNKSAFGLGQDDEMILTRVSSNADEWAHYHYQQYHKGIKQLEEENARIKEENDDLRMLINNIIQ